MRANVEASLAAEAASPIDHARELAERAMADLRGLATCTFDHDVLALLDAYDDGAFERREVLVVTELTAKRYRMARTRLAGYVEQLTEEIQEAARMRA